MCPRSSGDGGSRRPLRMPAGIRRQEILVFGRSFCWIGGWSGVMSRRLFALPVLALAASLAPSRPNAEEVGLHQIVLRQFGLAWRRCTEESFAARGGLRARHSAAELAFQSCRTQERAFVAGAMSH